jgi:hypothetical protein
MCELMVWPEGAKPNRRDVVRTVDGEREGESFVGMVGGSDEYIDLRAGEDEKAVTMKMKWESPRCEV